MAAWGSDISSIGRVDDWVGSKSIGKLRISGIRASKLRDHHGSSCKIMIMGYNGDVRLYPCIAEQLSTIEIR